MIRNFSTVKFLYMRIILGYKIICDFRNQHQVHNEKRQNSVLYKK